MIESLLHQTLISGTQYDPPRNAPVCVHSKSPPNRYGVWRVLLDLQFPVLLLRAENSLLTSEDVLVIPALTSCDASAAAAIQQAREAIERLRHDRTLRDIELWSAVAAPRARSWLFC
jgi:hypothetical protein